MALVVLIACSVTRDEQPDAPIPPPHYPPVDLHRGHYEARFEVSAFTACGSNESWWVGEGPPEPLIELQRAAVRAFRDSLALARGRRLYVELRGDTTTRGEHGHLGAYPRALMIRSISVVRAPQPSDCS